MHQQEAGIQSTAGTQIQALQLWDAGTPSGILTATPNTGHIKGEVLKIPFQYLIIKKKCITLYVYLSTEVKL